MPPLPPTVNNDAEAKALLATTAATRRLASSALGNVIHGADFNLAVRNIDDSYVVAEVVDVPSEARRLASSSSSSLLFALVEML